MRKYFIILENFEFDKIERPSNKDCWLEVIKNLGERMYKISPSVYEKADPALLELIERASLQLHRRGAGPLRSRPESP